MKQLQRSGRVSSTSRSSESEVAAILLELQTLIFGFPFTWGRKRKRSAIAVTSSSESPFPPPLSKSKAASPITPLSFSPSDYESDDHPTRIIKRNNVSIKRKREQCLKVIEEITNANNLLYGEVKNVQSYFDQLKDLNLKLKERKQELSLGPNQDNTVHKQLRLKFHGTAQHASLIANRTAVPPQIRDTEGVGGQATTSFGVKSFSGSGLGIAKTNSYDVGPTGIPDLNIPLEEPVHGSGFY